MSKRQIPPDPERMNGYRAEWAARAVVEFQEATEAEDVDALPELICNLAHFADRNAAFGSIAKAIERGFLNYLEETNGLGKQFQGVSCE